MYSKYIKIGIFVYQIKINKHLIILKKIIMKNRTLFKGVLLAFMTFAITACDNEDDSMVIDQDKNIVEIVTSNPDFSLLKTAVIRAGLAETLKGNGPFTVFAPNNDAFKAAGLTTEASINEMPVETLKSILLYHVLPSKVNSSAIPEGANTAVETAEENDIYVSKSNAGVFINGGKVIQADVLAKNGVIHVINKVLMPPMGDLVETLMGNDNFSMLVAAVVQASKGTTNVVEALKGEGPLTVFAPTNQAFINAGFPNTAAIEAADPATLTAILTYHVVSGNIFSNAISEGLTIAPLAGGSLMFSLNGGASVKGKSNTTPSKITGVDMLTDNGIIHVIDQVLLP